MAFTYKRPNSPFVWAEWKDGAGETHRESMKTADEAESLARALELERQSKEAATLTARAAPGELTVEGFARGEWLTFRKQARPLAWKDDLSRLVHHFFDRFGDWPLEKLATDDGSRALASWAVGLKAHKTKKDGSALASRSVWNVYSTVKVVLDDAVEWKRLKSNPLASFRADKYLPEHADKTAWRETAGFDLEQVVSLTTDPRLRPHRRVWNTLAFIVGGARTGELANLRWRDWTESYKGGIGRMVISTSYNTRSNVEKPTKTGAKKIVPVHPFAGRALRAWHEQGWHELMAREPTPADFIVPRSDGKQWRNGQLLVHFHADLDTLGIPRQRQYENRSTFRMLMIAADAPDFLVDRITHPSPKQASDWYTRTEQLWPALCEAIQRLDHAKWREAQNVSGTFCTPVPKVTHEVTQAAAQSEKGGTMHGHVNRARARRETVQ